MKIALAKFDEREVFGIYGATRDKMPERARYLEPAAARAYRNMMEERRVRISDMYRTAESSLAAHRSGRGAQMPGYSGHGYGFSIDIDVDWMLNAKGGRFLTKASLDGFMADHGWLCHLRGHERGREDWHYNFGVSEFLADTDARTSTALERKIQATYGSQLKLSISECQGYLRRLGLYHGAIDDIPGPMTREATEAFQRAWRLDVWKHSAAELGALGPKTQRVLAFVAAEKVIVTA